MPKITVLVGLPASGKSTYAREVVETTGNTTRINKDDLRSMCFNGVWTGKREKQIIAMRNSMISTLMREGHNIIIDDTNLHPVHVNQISRMVTEFNENVLSDSLRQSMSYKFEVNDSFLSVSPHDCIERDKDREKSVGANVIWDMYRKFIKGKEKDPLKKTNSPDWNDELSTAVVCDLDGTIAQMTERSPYDASRAMEDLPILPVVDLVRTYRNNRKVEIIFVTARENSEDGSNYEITNNWLKKFVFPDGNFTLIMRQHGDHRKDSVVKREMYDNHIQGRFNVLVVVDDRPQVVRMWKDELGLFVLNVGDCIDF